MNRAKVKQFQREAAEALKDVLAKHDLTLVGNYMTHGEASGKISLSVANISKPPAKKATQEEINHGLAPVGTLAYATDDGLYYEARILKTNIKRYVFEFVNYPEQGRYTIPFKGVQLAPKAELIAE